MNWQSLLLVLLASSHPTHAQDQSQPNPSSSPDPAPSTDGQGNTTYTPLFSNHTNPLWDPSLPDLNPYSVGVNNSYSPPVNYTRTRGHASWESAIARAREYITLNNLTTEEKVGLTTGLGWQAKGNLGRACVGNTAPIPRLNFTGFCLQDSPTGVRFTDGVSVFPAGVNIASTFDRALMKERGVAMGKEFKGKGVNVALGPGQSFPPLHRIYRDRD
jgi:hypothetical protein